MFSALQKSILLYIVTKMRLYSYKGMNFADTF